MQSFTLVIKMTGLLLLTPDTQAGNMPVHVLMPEPHGIDAHVAQVGYRSTAAECRGANSKYDRDIGICYQDMTGWLMDIPEGLTAPTSTLRLPRGLANVSSASSGLVDRSFFSDNPPGTKLRSRVSIHAGRPVDSCELGWWVYHTSLVALLTNVLTWEVPDAGQGSLVLRRRRFGSSVSEELVTLLPNNGIVELFIRQIPPDQSLHYMRMDPSHARNPTPASGRAANFSIGTRPSHFSAYYRMLGVTGPLPRLVVKYSPTCTWARSLDLTISGELDPFSPGTASCMVASALPVQ
jgi:hypothetical protein